MMKDMTLILLGRIATEVREDKLLCQRATTKQVAMKDVAQGTQTTAEEEEEEKWK